MLSVGPPTTLEAQQEPSMAAAATKAGGGGLRRGLYEKCKAGIQCDVVLAVGDKTFHAHKLVLMTSSQVFDRKFTVDTFKERRVKIEGTSPPLFEKFLELLYLEEVENWEGHELELLELCDRYSVEHLKAVCEKRLNSQMDSRSALGVLTFATQKPFVSSDLRRKAASVAIEDRELLSKPEWVAFEDSCGVVADVLRVAHRKNHPASAFSFGSSTTSVFGSAYRAT